jgi:5'-nucleotidase
MDPPYMSISLALRDTSLGLVPRFWAVLLAGGIAAAALFSTASVASAAPVIPADEPGHGLFTISANAPSVSPGETGFVTVHREGGTAGIVTVRVSSGDLSPELAALIHPIDETLSWPDGDATEQTVPIVFVDHDVDVPETGPSDLPTSLPTSPPTTTGRAADEQLQASETGVVSLAHAMAAADEGARPSLTVSLSAPTGGAAIGTPSSVSIVINAPPTTTPVTGGGDGGQPAESTTTTPGRQPGSQPGTTSPIGARESLADTGVQAIVPFIGATAALIAGLSAVMVIRRRRAIASTAAAATMEE